MKELKKLWPWRQLRGEKSCINWLGRQSCRVYCFLLCVQLSPKVFIPLASLEFLCLYILFIYLFLYRWHTNVIEVENKYFSG